RLEDAAGGRAPEAQAGQARRHVLDAGAPVLREVPADPGRVVIAEGRPRDDPEAIFREPRDGEVTLDSPVRVEHLRVRDRADVAGDAVVAHALEEVGGAGPDHVDLGERRLVEDRRRLAAGAVLGSDRRGPDLARPASGPEALVAARRVRLEPVRALPARLLPEGRAELLEPRVGRREPERPPGEPLLARILDVVVRRVDLVRARQGVVAAPVMRPEPARIHLPDVEARDSLHDPFGDQAAHPARARKTMCAESGLHPEPTHVGLAEDEFTVWRECFGPVDEADDLRVLELGHPDDGVRHELVEALP